MSTVTNPAPSANAPMPEGMSRETAVFVSIAFVLLMYLLTGSAFLLAVISALALLYMVPMQYLPRFFGYLTFTDIVFALWFVGVAASTFAGLQLAVITGLVYTVLSRELKAAWGSEVLVINGETKLSKQFAALAGYGIAWGKALIAGIKGPVVAPEPLTFTWTVKDAPGGFAATRTAQALRALRAKVFGTTATA